MSGLDKLRAAAQDAGVGARLELDRLVHAQRQLDELLPCTEGCVTEPEETCLRHGRPPSYWLQMASELQGQLNLLREAGWTYAPPAEPVDWLDSVKSNATPEQTGHCLTTSQYGLELYEASCGGCDWALRFTRQQLLTGSGITTMQDAWSDAHTTGRDQEKSGAEKTQHRLTTCVPSTGPNEMAYVEAACTSCAWSGKFLSPDDAYPQWVNAHTKGEEGTEKTQHADQSAAGSRTREAEELAERDRRAVESSQTREAMAKRRRCYTCGKPALYGCPDHP